MSTSFNLVDQPWIPIEWRAGGFQEVGLLDLLAKSHHIRSLAVDNPLEVIGLKRFLLAVLHRVFGPPDAYAWSALWQAGAWEASQLEDYLGQWYPRFDLLGEGEQRFYQHPPHSGEPASILHLVHPRANYTLFDHAVEASLLPAEAARAVIAAHAVRPGGFIKGQGDKDEKSASAAPAQKGIIFFAQGSSLFESTCLNLFPHTTQAFFQMTGIAHSKQDKPAWEQEDPFLPQRTRPFGYLDYLTWQNLHIWLGHVEDNGRIKLAGVGKRIDVLEEAINDPFKHYNRNKTKGLVVLNFTENKALWRNSSALLEQTSKPDGNRPPYPITWCSELFEEGLLDDAYNLINLQAVGMASDQAKIEFFRTESLSIPAAYFSEAALVSRLEGGLRRAEDIEGRLKKAVKKLAKLIASPSADSPSGRQPHPNDITNLTQAWRAEGDYWAQVEPAFWQLMQDLPQQGDAALLQWNKALIRAAEEAFARAEAAAGGNSRSIKASSLGWRELRRLLSPFSKEVKEWETALMNLPTG